MARVPNLYARVISLRTARGWFSSKRNDRHNDNECVRMRSQRVYVAPMPRTNDCPRLNRS